MRGAAHDQDLLFAAAAGLGQGRQALGHDLGGQGIELGALAFQLGQDFGPCRVERAAAQPRIEIVRGFRQRRDRQAERRVDQAVLDLAVFADHDDQRLARRDADEFDMLQRRHPAWR